MDIDDEPLVPLDTGRPIWDRFFTVSPLVIVGSKEGEGRYNLAPKHMAMPLGWDNYYCFVCSPRHTSYHNIRRSRLRSQSASRGRPRCYWPAWRRPRGARTSPSRVSLVLPTFPARQVEGVLVEGCYLFLECTLHSIVDGFGANSLIIGNVVAAAAVGGSLSRRGARRKRPNLRVALAGLPEPRSPRGDPPEYSVPIPKGLCSLKEANRRVSVSSKRFGQSLRRVDENLD